MEDILYTYHGQLYVNLTNQCPCACTFCIRSQTRAIGSAQDLWLKHDPSVEEVKAGNDEFKKAKEQTYAALKQNPVPALGYFMEHFLDGFELTLDELS